MKLRAIAVAVVAVVSACEGTPVATSSTPAAPTVVASRTDTATPTVAPAASTPTDAPTVEPTPYRSPRPPDTMLIAAARSTIDAVQLPKVFQYQIQLYEPQGNFHAAFGGFQGGVAILFFGRDDVRSNTVTHEYGHAWHEYFMKSDTKVWQQYGDIRGFTDPVRLSQGQTYLDDWRERFANDFQFAFNPDYEGRFWPSVGYWDPNTFDRFRAFVRSLPNHG